MSALLYFKNRFAEQYLYILLFGTIFLVVGYYAPKVFATFTDYYRLTQPISIDRKLYNKCDTINLTTTREATADLEITIVHQLIKVEKNEHLTKGITLKRDGVVPKGSHIVTFNLPVPCDAAPGVYFWASTVGYEVEGIRKTYLTTTEQFTVIDEPIQKVE